MQPTFPIPHDPLSILKVYNLLWKNLIEATSSQVPQQGLDALEQQVKEAHQAHLYTLSSLSKDLGASTITCAPIIEEVFSRDIGQQAREEQKKLFDQRECSHQGAITFNLGK